MASTAPAESGDPTNPAVERSRLPCHESVYSALSNPMLDFSIPASPKGLATCAQGALESQPPHKLPSEGSLIGSPEPCFDDLLGGAVPLSASWLAINAGPEFENAKHENGENENAANVECEFGQRSGLKNELNQPREFQGRNKLMQTGQLDPTNEFDQAIKLDRDEIHQTNGFDQNEYTQRNQHNERNQFNQLTDGFVELTNGFLVISMQRTNLRPSSASILSNSTDDEQAESMVIIPSFKTPSQILLFETDEEDEPERLGVKRRTLDFGDEASTLISNTGISKLAMFCDSLQPFIMPSVSFAASTEYFNLTIVSSSSSLVLQEANSLKQHLKGISSSANSSLNLLHVCLESPGSGQKKTLRSDFNKTRTSDLILIVNDGSLEIPELLAMLKECSVMPRFVVINLINSNYFINLLDIINVSTPQRIIKTFSLASVKVLDKIHDLITQEMTIHSHKKDPGEALSEDKCGSDKRKRKKYKQLEKMWISEFGASSYHKRIDPLRITGALGHLSVFWEFLERRPFKKVYQRYEKSWLAMSLALGIGLGVSINASRIFECFKAALFSSRPKNKDIAEVVPRKSIFTLWARQSKLFQNRVMEALREFLLVDMEKVMDAFRARAAASTDLIDSGLSQGVGMISTLVHHLH